MDTYCKNCGEPWDLYYVMHDLTPPDDEGFNFGVNKAVINKCPCCPTEEQIDKTKRTIRTCIIDALADVMGDDVDGMVSEMDDAQDMLI